MEKTQKKSIKIIPIILGLVIIAGAALGVKEYIYYSKHVDTDDAQIDGDISPVVARVSGYVDSILFEENEKVIQDQILIRLDDRDYQIKLEQALAAQRGASAGIDVSQSQISTTFANSSSAKA